MAFSETELKRIEKLVHSLCERRSPAHLKDKVWLGYTVKNHEVLIYEARPRWDEPSQWVESSIAKLRYVRASNEWRLYWQRANLKWTYYKSPSTLAAFRYKSAAKYHDVKSFYSTALIQQGWRLTNEWNNADLSAIPGLLTSGLTFSKGEYSVVIAYSGEKAIDLDSNYEIDIRWDEK